MSALAGIYNFDGAPIDLEQVSALGTALDSWGPDGGSEICAGSIGMAYRAFHTTRESRRERQPLASDRGHILTWDGRIDNRDELISLLRDLLPKQPTDTAIVMAAYLKWGEDFLKQLIGDFALALWDPIKQTLFLSRDPFGTRTLYYHANSERIFWASTLEPILGLARIPIEIEDDYIADYLTHHHPKITATPYKNVYAVEPGHVIIAHIGNVEARRFWAPDPNYEVVYKRDAEYEEHFRHLFFEGIRCRLRADGPIWAELSGGLDSSSIVCAADHLIKNGEANAIGPYTVSYLTKETENADEGKYIRYIEKYRGQPGYHLRLDEYSMRFSPPEKYFRSKPSTGLCSFGSSQRFHEDQGNIGARVMLSGLGGDQLLWSVPDPAPELATLLYTRRLRRLHRQLKMWSKQLKKPYLHALWQETLLPLMPGGVRARHQEAMKPPAWLDQEFVKKLKLRDRNPLPDDPYGFRLPSGWICSSQLLFIVTSISDGGYRYLRDIEFAYPFLHRPLVEFMLATPFEQKLRPGETRSIQRRALRDIVPDKVLRRRGKGSVHESPNHGLIREAPRLLELFSNAHVCERGYVDADAIRSEIELMRHKGTVTIVPILLTISLEIWLRSLELRYPVVKGHAGYGGRGIQKTMAPHRTYAVVK
jgi:asparagine synthase (glutamine-hydrolysing)